MINDICNKYVKRLPMREINLQKNQKDMKSNSVFKVCCFVMEGLLYYK
jgi:hypothetical protein